MTSDQQRAGAAAALGIVAAVILDQFLDRYLAVILAVLVGLATWWLTGLVPSREQPPAGSDPGTPPS